jgi:hypothetical protein
MKEKNFKYEFEYKIMYRYMRIFNRMAVAGGDAGAANNKN